jgi:hypothetical protein
MNRLISAVAPTILAVGGAARSTTRTLRCSRRARGFCRAYSDRRDDLEGGLDVPRPTESRSVRRDGSSLSARAVRLPTATRSHLFPQLNQHTPDAPSARVTRRQPSAVGGPASRSRQGFSLLWGRSLPWSRTDEIGQPEAEAPRPRAHGPPSSDRGRERETAVLLVSVVLDVRLRRFGRVMVRVLPMAVGRMGVVSGLAVVAGVMMLGRFVVMSRSVLVVLRRLLVVIRSLLGHGLALRRWTSADDGTFAG